MEADALQGCSTVVIVGREEEEPVAAAADEMDRPSGHGATDGVGRVDVPMADSHSNQLRLRQLQIVATF